MATDIKDASYGFEAVKSVLRQSKDGIVISLVIHPNDIPGPLLSDPIGSRYMVGMARLGDDEEIIEPEGVREGKRMVTSAGALCRDDDFQMWLVHNGFSPAPTEEAAATTVKRLLKVKSRAELKENVDAQHRWSIIRQHFIDRAILMEADIDG
tara:strand:- start:12758 stop:13216 length:459 start_codon:yes stop_codon:yes gene_type:complete